jgi:RNA polymerase sigma-70 factor, ECF subfamily
MDGGGEPPQVRGPRKFSPDRRDPVRDLTRIPRDTNELELMISTSPSRVAEPVAFSGWDDLALMYAVQRRDERALAVLFDRHSSSLLGFVMRFVPDQSDAESVLLEVFAQAWRDAERYSPDRGPVVSWLVMIARSRALDAARATVRRARVMPMSMDDAPQHSLEARDSSSDPTHEVEQRERRERLASALATLPESQRTAIHLTFYEGLSHSDVATQLGEPLGTIKTRIRLGMTKLRAALSGEFGEALP